MYHHAESPEVINAKLAEWERTATAHAQQHEVKHLLTVDAEACTPHPVRSLIEHVRRFVRPARRMHELPHG